MSNAEMQVFTTANTYQQSLVRVSKREVWEKSIHEVGIVNKVYGVDVGVQEAANGVIIGEVLLAADAKTSTCESMHAGNMVDG